MAKRKAGATAQPAASASKPSAASLTASSASSSRTPSDPLPTAHYIPRVPLQLLAIGYSLVISARDVDLAIRGPPRIVKALVDNPLGTLPTICGLVAAVQCWFGYWARSCKAQAKRAAEKGEDGEEDRPVKSSLSRTWAKALRGEAPASFKKRSSGGKGGVAGGLDTTFVPQAVMVTLLGAAFFHACAVLLGASLTTNVTSTFLMSLLLSLLSITPLAIAIPPFTSPQERYTWLRLFSSLSPNDNLEIALLAPALGAIVGCWAGAIPIPLDWDRPWQRWPTTCILGALGGHAAGTLVSLAVVGWRSAVVAAVDVLEEVKQKEQKQQAEGSRAVAGAGKKRQ
ncbi:hypothetical protein Rhopal_000172-T1 [Rhodotorula paludigena]|uniref:GPI biosynthesis protein Pig-F n=1 Tax=Rhodotorula paludigena TaxID=86838 RepID=A0AAV5GD32_9BASI|nr:hypothetical protein Rhopal_000172-T1 [Rhodotorula paludigena]